MRKPTPEFVIAVLALFVALAGTANAVVDAAVPLARRALVAENGKTAREVANSLGPASTAAGLVSTRTKAILISPGPGNTFTIDCNPNEKVVGGGYASNAAVLNLVLSYPVSERSWLMGLANVDDKVATTTLYAICVR
jgi:hypothetical protein